MTKSTQSLFCFMVVVVIVCVALYLIPFSEATQHIITETGDILVPLSFKLSDGSNKQIHVSFKVDEENLEQIVTNYCEVQNVRYHFCHKLFTHMQRIQQMVQWEQADKHILTKSYNTQIQGLHRYQRPSALHNPDLIRYREALHAQLTRTLRHTRTKRPSQPQGQSQTQTQQTYEEQLMNSAETQAISILQQVLQRIHEREEIVRIAVIHSAGYSKDEQNRELRILLESLKQHALMDELQLVLVIHYGQSIEYDSTITADYPTVNFIHLSEDLSFGELPTLRILQGISRYLSSTLLQPSPNSNIYKDQDIDPVHILYMRTLTSEFQGIHQSLEDWRSLLLYHLVEEHWSCFHLIESREIDVVAANFVNNPRALNGNYFWASAHFLGQLPLIPYDFPNYESVAAEWLFTSPFMKIHVPHISQVNHEWSRYPRYCYAPSNEDNNMTIPSYEEYKEICSKKTLEDYSILHNQSALSDFPPYSEEFHNINSLREVTSSCSTLELSIVFESDA